MTRHRGSGDRPAGLLRRAWNRPARSARRRLVELLVLTGFVVAQPVLEVYGKSSEVFVLRDISGRGVVAFTAVVVLAPPLLLWLLGTLAARLDARLGALVHEVTMLLLWCALWVEVLDFAGAPAGLSAAAGVLLGIGSAMVVSLRPALRMWVTFASPAPLVFALVFLTMTPVSGGRPGCRTGTRPAAASRRSGRPPGCVRAGRTARASRPAASPTASAPRG